MAKPQKPHKRMVYRMYFDGGIYEGDKWDISKQTGASVNMLTVYLSAPTDERYGYAIGHKWPIYEFYRGRSGQYAGTGIVPEIAEVIGVGVTTLTTGGAYRKVFTGDYTIVEDEDMREKRTLNRVAPVPTERKYDSVEEKKLVTMRPATVKQFRVGEYAQSLHDWYFKGWAK